MNKFLYEIADFETIYNTALTGTIRALSSGIQIFPDRKGDVNLGPLTTNMN